LGGSKNGNFQIFICRTANEEIPFPVSGSAPRGSNQFQKQQFILNLNLYKHIQPFFFQDIYSLDLLGVNAAKCENFIRKQ
jgi:hypothetical protein